MQDKSTIAYPPLSPPSATDNTPLSTWLQEQRASTQYQIPPNFALSKIHKESTKMLMRQGVNIESSTICSCCGEIAHAPQFPICAKSSQFAYYGFGISLFYTLVKYLSVVVMLLLLILGLYMRNIYRIGGRISDILLASENDMKFNIISQFSIGGLKSTEAYMNISMYGFILLLTLYFSWNTLRKLMSEQENKLTSKNLSPSQYTLILQGLPGNVTEDGIRKCLISKGNMGEISRVVLTYPGVNDYLRLKTRLLQLEMMKSRIEGYRNIYARKFYEKSGYSMNIQDLGHIYPPGRCKNYEILCQDLGKLRANIVNMELKLGAPKSKKGNIAFVTCSSTGFCDYLLDKYEVSEWEYVCKCRGLKYEGSTIKVDRAPEPEEIIWENLSYSRRSKFWRKLVAMVYISGISSMCWLPILALTTAKELGVRDKSSPLGMLGSISISIFVMIVNTILEQSIQRFTSFERHYTHTELEVALISRMSLATSFNTIFVPFIIQFFLQGIHFTKGGFVNYIFSTWVTLGIIKPTVSIVDPGYIFHRIKAWWGCRGECLLTQQEANELYTPPAQNWPAKYSHVLLLMLYSVAYMLYFPPGVIVTLVGLGYNYWVQKILMLRRYRKPVRYSARLPIYCTQFMYLFIITLVVTTICFSVRYLPPSLSFFSWIKCIGWILLYPCIFLVIVAFLWVFRVFCGERGIFGYFLPGNILQTERSRKYKEVKYPIDMFGMSDYMALNPCTREKALMEFNTRVKETTSTTYQ